jgi:hypothetical protein
MPAKPTDTAALRRERMTASPRFENGVFRNTHPVAQGLKKGTVLPTLGEYLCGGQRRTPKGPMPIAPPLVGWPPVAG